LEGSSSHLKILLESGKCDFEEISKKYYRISPIYFQLNLGEMVNTIAHQK
jgi:hypothetical protein